jgi:hypothetical protein
MEKKLYKVTNNHPLFYSLSIMYSTVILNFQFYSLIVVDSIVRFLALGPVDITSLHGYQKL